MSRNILIINGTLVQSEVPPVSTFLEKHSGAYTTSRTQRNATSILFWERHMLRLADSANILLKFSPHLLGPTCKTSISVPLVHSLAQGALREGLPIVLNARNNDHSEELAATALISGNPSTSYGLDFYLHIGFYVPPLFGIKETGASLAVVGHGRQLAGAKYAEWVRKRKELQRLRPSLTTDLLLTNDRDGLLEGTVTNFFVVCRREIFMGDSMVSNHESLCPFEVQTAPVGDVLPGVIRQLIISICQLKGIPVREIPPSWSHRTSWDEAFITNSLKLIQHVELIQFPVNWDGLHSMSLQDISWEEKWFVGPGVVTTEIQKELTRHSDKEGYPIENLL